MVDIFPLFYLLWQAVLLLVLLDMTQRRRSSASMIAWFLVIFSLPYLGVILYLLIGRRKLPKTPSKRSAPQDKDRTKMHPYEALLYANGIHSAEDGNTFTLITNDQAAFDMLTEAISRAERSISIATYIFKMDSVGTQIAHRLIERARAGVEVKLLIDAFGSLPLYLYRKALSPLIDAGVAVEFFMPLRPFWRNTHINLRLHRKIYLFDDRSVFSGGMNLSRDYLGTPEHPGRWNDLLFRLEGPAVRHYRAIFVSDWNFSSEAHIDEKRIDPPHPGSERIQVVPSGPDLPTDAMYDLLLDAIHKAQKRIGIVTPYFIPDETIMHALRIALTRGVRVTLITPKQADHFLFDAARSSYMRELAELGGEVKLYAQRMLHAKAMLFDDEIAIVGTLNFDRRSLFLNYEVVSIGYSATIIETLEHWMAELAQKSTETMKPAGRLQKVVENLGRIIAPQL